MTREPTTTRGKRSRDRIITAADELIAKRGVNGAGLDEILAAAGASKSQLYHYFADKDDLVHATVARRGRRHIEVQLPLLTQLDSWAAIDEWFAMTIDVQEAQGFPGCPIGTLASELADRDETARTALSQCFGAWEGYLVDGLRRMRERGELIRDADPEAMATAVFAALQGGLLLANVRKDAQPLRIALDAARAYVRSFSST